ncbi:MAG: hypothetical protein OEU26_09155, partial [Candidatus Tectomicrobia bacterium]|nr:hypothetical protein [Candidatus Tectomicrobia bacterium]
RRYPFGRKLSRSRLDHIQNSCQSSAIISPALEIRDIDGESCRLFHTHDTPYRSSTITKSAFVLVFIGVVMPRRPAPRKDKKKKDKKKKNEKSTHEGCEETRSQQIFLGSS